MSGRILLNFLAEHGIFEHAFLKTVIALGFSDNTFFQVSFYVFVWIVLTGSTFFQLLNDESPLGSF